MSKHDTRILGRILAVEELDSVSGSVTLMGGSYENLDFDSTSGDLTVTDLTDILGQSQPRISRHLKLLAEAGLVLLDPDLHDAGALDAVERRAAVDRDVGRDRPRVAGRRALAGVAGRGLLGARRAAVAGRQGEGGVAMPAKAPTILVVRM